MIFNPDKILILLALICDCKLALSSINFSISFEFTISFSSIDFIDAFFDKILSFNFFELFFSLGYIEYMETNLLFIWKEKIFDKLKFFFSVS